MTTLTIQVDDVVLRRAEHLAQLRGTTVEAMLEQHVRALAMPRPEPEELPPITRSLLGILPPMSDEDASRIVDEERVR